MEGVEHMMEFGKEDSLSGCAIYPGYLIVIE